MDTQTQIADNLYGLLETQEDPQGIMDTILQIDDLNRWNINITDYLRYEMDIDNFVIDVENPEQTHTAGPGGSFVPIPIDYGESILDFVILLLIGGDNWDLDFFDYPMADEIVRFLVINGAKSSPALYLKWLSVEDEYEGPDDFPEAFMKYEKIKKYLGLFNTVNRLKNVRNKNRKAKTIQRRLRGNRSRLYNAYPTQYMKSKPHLRDGAWNIIERGLIDDGIATPDREKFKENYFNRNWSDNNQKARTIQRRVRGNRSRLYNAYPTQYMKSKPRLRDGSWNIIDKGLREGEIESPDREIFKTEHFDPKWMSDREREKVGNRLMSEYVDELNKYGGKKKKRTQKRMKGGTGSSNSFHTPMSSPIDKGVYYDADDGMPDCPICLDELKYYNNGRYMPLRSLYTTDCNHNFHFDCAKRHLSRDNRCPMCRNEIYDFQEDDLQEDDLEMRFNALNRNRDDNGVFDDLEMRLNALRRFQDDDINDDNRSDNSSEDGF